MVNTLAQYVRLLFKVIISLYSTRLVLGALGQNDYGIYSLVGGVVVMLGFMTNAMVVTTQRHLSYLYGKKDVNAVRATFSNCLLLHILISVTLAIVLLLLEPVLFERVLVIDAERVAVAMWVYRFAVAALCLTFIVAPYRALYIARENIVYISVIDVIDSFLRLIIAVMLYHVSYDRLAAYGFLMVLISVVNYFLLAVYGRVRFAECLLLPRRKDVELRQMRQIVGFAGWTIYSMGCVLGRSQGMAVLLNRFFGTMINTAYGIANQVFASVSYVAQSVVNAMSPQIVKSEGAGDRQRMLRLAAYTSKFSLLLLALVVIPIVFEMPGILKFWLGTVPEHAVTLCSFILLTSLCDQTTIGLNVANQAIGKIRNYSLCINTVKLLTLVAAWLCLRHTRSVSAAMGCYIAMEIVCAAARLPFLKYTAGLSVRRYAAFVFLPSLLPLSVLVLVSWLFTTYVNMPLRFLFTFAVAAAAGALTIWTVALGRKEREIVTGFIRRRKGEC